jgi:hypothetical protein
MGDLIVDQDKEKEYIAGPGQSTLSTEQSLTRHTG